MFGDESNASMETMQHNIAASFRQLYSVFDFALIQRPKFSASAIMAVRSGIEYSSKA